MVSGAGSAAQSLWDASGQLVQPTLRLGVTGLARSGKTVFTTALVHHLTRGTPLPAFRAARKGASAGRAWRTSPTTRWRASRTRSTPRR
jgi:predicted YcjX-like family ATPase